MKVLWYEITVPAQYVDSTIPIAGWQDSLQTIVSQHYEIDLYIAFEGKTGMQVKKDKNVTYIPLIPKMSLWGSRVLRFYNQKYVESRLLPCLLDVVRDIRPDVIHVFGTEWGLGSIANLTKTPVVIHMMGCVAPYVNAILPPNYSILDSIKSAILNPVRLYHIIRGIHYNKTWISFEKGNFSSVKNYMGRTAWDKAMCELFHSGCNYYYCSEALRPSFIENQVNWVKPNNAKVQLLTIGCTTHWKGLDTLLKTANILKMKGFSFEWKVAGKMPDALKCEIEKKENLTFLDSNIDLLGYVGSNDLVSLLLSTNIYVHTAYIDNSPNTVCEAQYLGLPIIATYVGGIPSLIENNIEGLLVPANDPYRLAYEIEILSMDEDRQLLYSELSRKRARERHNPQKIYSDLLLCYNSIINNQSIDV